MSHIAQSDWWLNSYARVAGLARTLDILNQPELIFYSLTGKARNRFRQSQVFSCEIVRVLGVVGAFHLVMKFEGTIGWLLIDDLEFSKDVSGFETFISDRMAPLDFLNFYRGTPYLWGGLSAEGIDCSGLVQLYFLKVSGLVLPKNSRAQRKLICARSPLAACDNDLVFGVSRQSGKHHVGLWFQSKIWHAYSDGVVAHSWERFSEIIQIEETGSIAILNTGYQAPM